LPHAKVPKSADVWVFMFSRMNLVLSRQPLLFAVVAAKLPPKKWSGMNQEKECGHERSYLLPGIDSRTKRGRNLA
jgi:hypothetical protein